MTAACRLLVALLVSTLISHTAASAAGRVRQEHPDERRIHAIASKLRCPVCQGETVYDSHSTVANQMKSLIREQVAAGRTDTQIEAFFVSRYGAFVLMEPAAEGLTLVIWAFPAVALSIALACILLLFHRRRESNSPPSETVHDTEEFLSRLERLGP